MLRCPACVRTCLPLSVCLTRSANHFRNLRHVRPGDHSLSIPQSCPWRRTYVLEAQRATSVDSFIPSAKVNPQTIQKVHGEPGEAIDHVEFSKAQLDRELQWLPDPLKLADKTKYYLQRGTEYEVRKAMALVRHASKKMSCTVSWNHVIHYYMTQGHVNTAVKCYNEVYCLARLLLPPLSC